MNVWLAILIIVTICTAGIYYAARTIISVYQALPAEKKYLLSYVYFRGYIIAVLPMGLVERFFLSRVERVVIILTDRRAARQGNIGAWIDTQRAHICVPIVLAANEAHRCAINRTLRFTGRASAWTLKTTHGSPPCTYYVCHVPRISAASFVANDCETRFAQVPISEAMGIGDPWLAPVLDEDSIEILRSILWQIGGRL